MNQSTSAAAAITVIFARHFVRRNFEANTAQSHKAQGAHQPMPALSAQGRLNADDRTRAVARQGARLIALCALLVPSLAAAQSSPFLTGATALESNILAWLTPVAVILVMVLGAMAMANRISWAWCIAAILGIAIAFGAPQIVTWVRGMFGV
ncbi:MAG: TrbC/VirB2 family protein [Steroidobacteraceae bacterium]